MHIPYLQVLGAGVAINQPFRAIAVDAVTGQRGFCPLGIDFDNSILLTLNYYTRSHTPLSKANTYLGTPGNRSPPK